MGIEKQVCKKASLQKKQVCKKVCIFKKMQQQVCKNLKKASLQKSLQKSLHIQKLQQQVCKIKKSKSAKSLLKVCKKVCIFKRCNNKLQNKKASLQKVCLKSA